jgi:hypothetical protein
VFGWWVNVDDQINAVNMNASRGNIGCDQDSGLALAEGG